jgi:hypothetical protein
MLDLQSQYRILTLKIDIPDGWARGVASMLGFWGHWFPWQTGLIEIFPWNPTKYKLSLWAVVN